jgi:hypothetical protein
MTNNVKVTDTDIFISMKLALQRALWICFAIRKTQGVHIVISHQNAETGMSSSVASWAGEQRAIRAYEPDQAHGQISQLSLLQGEVNSPVLSPLGIHNKYGKIGGARFGSFMMGVAGLSEEHSQLLSMLTLYSIHESSLRLHHVGFRYPTEKEMLDESAKVSNNPLARAAEDHKRIYHHVVSLDKPDYYHEVQFFPGSEETSVHLDFVTTYPVPFLFAIAKAMGVEPEIFLDACETDPAGAVWITDVHGNKIGIMARPKWWTV